MAVDYTGIATLVASLTASAVTLISLMRQGRNKASTDEQLAVFHNLANGQSAKVADISEKLGIEKGKVIGADQERENPTERVTK